MTKRFNLFALVMIVLLGAPYYWLLLDNRPGNAAPKPISMTQLRQLAASMPGDAPFRVEMEHVAYRRLPGNLFVAGSGLKRQLVGIMAWHLPVRDSKGIVIDSGLTRRAAEEMGLEHFDEAAQAHQY